MNKQGKDGIDYCDYTWSPITGCKNICSYCYARAIATRFKGSKAFPDGFEPTFHPDRLAEPGKLNKPAKIFVCNMGDLFGCDNPVWIAKVLHTIQDNPQHTFLLITKYPLRMYLYNSLIGQLKNVWLGVTVDKPKELYYLENLVACEAKVKFISFEPLLAPMNDVDLTGIDWIIIGGQSGRNKFVPPEEWVWDLQTKADKLRIPVFLKDNLELYTGIPRRKVVVKKFPVIPLL